MSKLFAALLLSFSGLTATIVHYAPSTWGAPSAGQRGGGWGGHFTAPEIDPSSAIAALTLLVGGLALIRGRIAKQ
jgi:hypothetical protein